MDINIQITYFYVIFIFHIFFLIKKVILVIMLFNDLGVYRKVYLIGFE